jgi:hypothetical protein
MQREHPWHLRRATWRHHRRLRDLSERYELTGAWLLDAAEAGLQAEPAPWLRPGALAPEEEAGLWMLELLEEREVDPLLDDTLPEDALGRLELTIRGAERETARSILGAGMLEAAARASYRHGQTSGAARWRELPGASRLDARALLLALEDSPFRRERAGGAFLVRRAVERSVSLELLECPHGEPAAGNRRDAGLAGAICALHAEWMRGFLHALNPRLIFSAGGGPSGGTGARCTREWTLP